MEEVLVVVVEDRIIIWTTRAARTNRTCYGYKNLPRTTRRRGRGGRGTTTSIAHHGSIAAPRAHKHNNEEDEQNQLQLVITTNSSWTSRFIVVVVVLKLILYSSPKRRTTTTTAPAANIQASWASTKNKKIILVRAVKNKGKPCQNSVVVARFWFYVPPAQWHRPWINHPAPWCGLRDVARSTSLVFSPSSTWYWIQKSALRRQQTQPLLEQVRKKLQERVLQ